MRAELSPGQWIDAVALRLQQRWPTVDPEQLAEVACDLLKVPELRAMLPAQAAAEWLRPVEQAE